MTTKARFTRRETMALAAACRELLATPPSLAETMLACGDSPPSPDAGWCHMAWLNNRLRERKLVRVSAECHAAREGLDALKAAGEVDILASVSTHQPPRKYYRWARLKPRGGVAGE